MLKFTYKDCILRDSIGAYMADHIAQPISTAYHYIILGWIQLSSSRQTVMPALVLVLKMAFYHYSALLLLRYYPFARCHFRLVARWEQVEGLDPSW